MTYATVEEVRARLQSGEDIDYLDDRQFEQKLSGKGDEVVWMQPDRDPLADMEEVRKDATRRDKGSI